MVFLVVTGGFKPGRSQQIARSAHIYCAYFLIACVLSKRFSSKSIVFLGKAYFFTVFDSIAFRTVTNFHTTSVCQDFPCLVADVFTSERSVVFIISAISLISKEPFYILDSKVVVLRFSQSEKDHAKIFDHTNAFLTFHV
jgi:hypothetical protein